MSADYRTITHASHCMTTSRPAAATEIRVKAMHPKVFLCRTPSLPQPSLFPGSEYAGLHTLRVRSYHMQWSAHQICD